MIHLFQEIDHLKDSLEQLLSSKAILNFHIALKLNKDIYVYLLSDALNSKIEDFIRERQDVEVRVITQEEQSEEVYYQEIFENPKGSINIKNSRRRLMHLLGEDNKDENWIHTDSIVTFYSYKGGLGRSTTLASFAMALANGVVKRADKMISPQKVVILDLDLESPGFTNYFLEDAGKPKYHNGVVEYLTDLKYNTNTDINQYIWKVSQEFAGQGEIWVMPAGNLNPDEVTDDFLKNNLSHYLEGLARLDISSPVYLVKQIKEKIIQKIQDTIQPDFILIDSRTGFNDIFGITALQLSDTVVGFFGSGAQTDTGLYFFLNTLLKHHKTKGFVVNAILPEWGWRTMFKSFQQKMEEILKSIPQNGQIPPFPVFKINRNGILENIGIRGEDISYFQDLILDREFKDYYQLFDKIYASSKKV